MEGGRPPLIIVSSSENLITLSLLCLLLSQYDPNQNLTNATYWPKIASLVVLSYRKTSNLDLLGF